MLLILIGLLLLGGYFSFILSMNDKKIYLTISKCCFILFLILIPRIATLTRNSKHYTISTEIRQKSLNNKIIKSDTIYIIKYKTK